MKKTIPFLIIVIALFALTLGSERIIDGMFTTLNDAICATEESLRADDFDTALTHATASIDCYDNNERVFTLFMPSETLHLLEASIYGMETYIKEENRTEALAEAARAHAQLDAIWTMYFRAI